MNVQHHELCFQEGIRLFSQTCLFLSQRDLGYGVSAFKTHIQTSVKSIQFQAPTRKRNGLGDEILRFSHKDVGRVSV